MQSLLGLSFPKRIILGMRCKSGCNVVGFLGHYRSRARFANSAQTSGDHVMLNLSKMAALATTCALFFGSPARAQTVIYVDAGATGVSGDKWCDAARDLQDALSAARQPESTVVEIRVAQGVYKPAESGHSADRFAQDRRKAANARPWLSSRQPFRSPKLISSRSRRGSSGASPQATSARSRPMMEIQRNAFIGECVNWGCG